MIYPATYPADDDRIPLVPISPDSMTPCSKSRRALHALLMSIGLLGCRSEAPPAPDAAGLQWSTHRGTSRA